MSEPEISRRCRSCGASLPRRASFCPECGVSRAELTGESGPRGGKAQAQDGAASIESRIKPAYSKTRRTVADDGLKAEPAASQFGAEHETGRRGRVREAREAVKENLLPRVEKIKSVSNDVLDEASGDPSFRFLLVAGILFVISIVLLVFSQFLR